MLAKEELLCETHPNNWQSHFAPCELAMSDGQRDVERTKLTPPEIARRWGIKSHKVLAWIRSGDLRAINAAATLDGRPRYLIDLEDLAAFERAREVVAKKPRRSRKSQDVGITEFF